MSGHVFVCLPLYDFDMELFRQCSVFHFKIYEFMC
jgi:hypothetical protein